MSGARQNADEARQNAQEAQEKYAEQASKDAEIIRRKANETKSAAHQLRGEADHLNGRVVVTENRITKLSDNIKEDNALTEEAKEKVLYTYLLFSKRHLKLLQFETHSEMAQDQAILIIPFSSHKKTSNTYAHF